MAKRTIIVGINQTIMAALSMATIAAFIDAPGLGKPVVKALESLDVGTAVRRRPRIVIMAIMLDRVTTAASERERERSRGRARHADAGGRRPRLPALVVAGGLRLPVPTATSGRPRSPATPTSAAPSRARSNAVDDWVSNNCVGRDRRDQERRDLRLLNPLQSCSPSRRGGSSPLLSRSALSLG